MTDTVATLVLAGVALAIVWALVYGPIGKRIEQESAEERARGNSSRDDA